MRAGRGVSSLHLGVAVDSFSLLQTHGIHLRARAGGCNGCVLPNSGMAQLFSNVWVRHWVGSVFPSGFIPTEIEVDESVPISVCSAQPQSGSQTLEEG